MLICSYRIYEQNIRKKIHPTATQTEREEEQTENPYRHLPGGSSGLVGRCCNHKKAPAGFMNFTNLTNFLFKRLFG